MSDKPEMPPLPLNVDMKKKENHSSKSKTFFQNYFSEDKSSKISHDDSLLTCLEIIASFHGVPTSTVSLKAGLPIDNQPFSPPLFIRAAERIKLSSKILHKKLTDISPYTLPCVLMLEGGKACLMVAQPTPEDAEIIFPETGQGSTLISLTDLNQIYNGQAIFCQPLYRYDQRLSDIEIDRPKSWFWKTISKSWSLYIQVALAAILVNLFAIASPLYVMNVYDRVVPNNSVSTLWVLSAGIFIVFIFDFLLKMLRVYYVDEAGRKADILLASRIYEHVLGMRLASRPPSAGSFANQLREFETLRDFFSSASLVAFVDFPFIFIFIIIIATIGGNVAWVAFLSIPLIIAVSLALQGPLRSWVNKSYKEGAQKHALLVESIHGLETIKSFGGEGRMQRHWERFVAQSATSSIAVRFLNALAINFTGFIQQVSYALTVVVGVYLIAAGELTTGGLIACTILYSRAMSPLSQIVGLLSRFNQSKTALEALNKIISLPTERSENQSYLHRPTLQGNIEFKEVSFTYPHQKTKALNSFNLTLRAGEKIGIVGRIGSGKSTIERLLLNLYSPQEGTIKIDETDIRQIDPADLRNHIGYVPQEIYLFHGTIRENITFGTSGVTDEEILKVSILSGVHEFVRQHPMGYDMPVGEGGSSLSGGQRQSVAIARALIRDAHLMIFDEPSAMMDNTSEIQLVQKLQTIIQDKTLLIISHRLPLLKLTERLVVMDNGRVIADGPRDEVLRALSHSQIRSAG